MKDIVMALMKPDLKTLSSMVIGLSFCASAQAVTLASWEDWDDTAATTFNAEDVASGFSASIGYDETRTSTSFGSNDGTYGSLVNGANTAGGTLLVRELDGSSFNVTLTNNTGSAYSIDSIHFDFAPRQNGNEADHGYDGFTLTYVSGGLGPDSTEIDSQSNLGLVILDGNINAISNYPDYDYDLSVVLSDTILDDGESATFEFAFYGQTTQPEGANTSSAFDNLAFEGATIPEPSTLVMLVAIGGLCVLLRRRC